MRSLHRLPLPLRWLLAVAGVSCAAPAAHAQCGTGAGRPFDGFTVTPAALTFPDVGVTEFDRGWSTVMPVVVSVDVTTGNRTRPWYLCLRATTATFPAGGYAKPIGDLQWSLDGSTWTSVTVTEQQVGPARTGDATLPLYVRLLVRYADDPPATYGPAPLSFTVSH